MLKLRVKTGFVIGNGFFFILTFKKVALCVSQGYKLKSKILWV